MAAIINMSDLSCSPNLRHVIMPEKKKLSVIFLNKIGILTRPPTKKVV